MIRILRAVRVQQSVVDRIGRLSAAMTPRSFFYRVVLCIAPTVLSQDVCLSVRQSHAGIVSKLINIILERFSSSGRTPF